MRRWGQLAFARSAASLLDIGAASTSGRPISVGRPCSGHILLPARTFKLFEIFSKEKSAQRRARLKTDLQKGYFDDFKQLRDTQGRVFEPDSSLTLARNAVSVPELQVVQPDGSGQTFPTGMPSFSGGLLCIAFREGAESMLQPWHEAFAREFAGHASLRWFQLSLIESKVMSVWPFSSMILKSPLRSRSEPDPPNALKPTHLFHFGVAEAFKRDLGLVNQLSGYVYLIDGTGRVRWRASGTSSQADIALMLQLARQLFNEPTFQGHS